MQAVFEDEILKPFRSDHPEYIDHVVNSYFAMVFGTGSSDLCHPAALTGTTVIGETNIDQIEDQLAQANA